MRKKYQLLLPLIAVLLWLGGCDSNQSRSQSEKDERLSDTDIQALQKAASSNRDQVFQFGFDLRSSPQEDARQYLPFLSYLEQKTGYRFQLRFTPENGEIVEDLGKGVIHFAAIGAVSFIQAADSYGAIPLVRGLNTKNEAEYRSMIVVDSQSAINTVADLKGKRLAFGSTTSTQGHLIPRIVLIKNNIKLTDLESYEYTGSHQKCADAVISGRFDACGLQDTMAKELEREQKLRILHQSDFYPSSGIVANKEVPPEVLDKIVQAMLDFDPNGRDANTLYNWHKTEMPNGFVTAQNNDYASLREWLAKLKLVKPETDPARQN